MRKIALAAALTFSLVVGLGARSGAQGYLAADENRSADLLNEIRKSVGAGSLPRNAALNEMARGQAVRMAAKGEIFHNTSLMGEAKGHGLSVRMVGENVGMGPSVESIHHAFVDSQGHYDNMVRPNFNAIGVGVVDGGNGWLFVAHVFAQMSGAPAGPQQVQSPAPAPATAAPAPAAPAPATPAPTAEPATPDPNALEGGRINLEVVFGR